jgi:3(or 17)beta-hydroxysteroid dehydrogenase
MWAKTIHANDGQDKAMIGRVEGKVALVTGGAMGIGLASARLLAAEGAHVIIADLANDAGSAAAAALGGEARFVRLDVTGEADWARAIAFTEAEFGRLDILINNAGIVIPGTIEQATLDSLRRHLAVHVEGTFLGCSHALPVMVRGGGGAIVNLGSIAALTGQAPFFAYSAAKGAIRAMSRSIAAHCQQAGNKVRCNTVFPGGIETPMIQALVRRAAEAIPGGVLAADALGAPQDVAAAVLYLAGDESRFLTGAEIVVDNGATALARWP